MNYLLKILEMMVLITNMGKEALQPNTLTEEELAANALTEEELKANTLTKEALPSKIY